MKRFRTGGGNRLVIFSVLLALVLCGQVGASERVAVQTQVPELVYGVAVDNPQLSIGVVWPHSSRWSVHCRAAVVWSRAEGAAYRQVSVATLARRALGGDQSTADGWYAAAGATAAWFDMDGADSITAVVLGPTVEVGYRFLPGAGRLLLEPYVGAGCVAGPRFRNSGGTEFGSNAGLYGGISLGWLLRE